ncbi:pseudouridine synthase [Mucilaginibacter gracilis]|uniref:Pseudouridine synthase n=1 Tax=Mucilaginibacter gracilis TaxID=423350 RepID=A0A495J9E6_9SPHI|nr:pseudouridine synthase [Mucilaginibacter gracilis]RKR85527.1 pseudouridine synthase [Mucilaginibacter gracilis]
MAFKKSGNSRDDKSNNTSRRTSNGGPDKSKRTTSSSRPRSTSAGPKKFEGENDGPKKSFDGEKKSFNKNFNKPTGDFKKSPYGTRDFNQGPPKSEGSFKKAEGGDSPRAGRRPYGTRDSSPDSRPPREGGFKKEGASDFKRKPYGTRDSAPDSRPPREGGFKKASGDAPSFSRKPYGTRDTGDTRPPREGGFKKEGGFKGKTTAAGTDSRPFRARKEDDNKDKKTVPYNREPKRTVKPPQRSTREGFSAADEQPDRTMRSRKKSTQDPDKGKIRLNRYISNAGICSRRKADELIVAGVVSVNGQVISELGFKVDPYKDEVRYNGETLKREKMVYVLLNKPKDYITTTEDPQERRTVMHLVDKASKERIYPVGRLDRNTTGLLLMTNDGDLADKLSHPKSNISKLYHVELDKSLSQGDLNKIGYGIELEDGLIKPDSVSYVTGASKREVGIQIHSGKNRVVRRIFESLGYDVVKLDRAIYAGLTKKDLPRGRWRYLEEAEIIQLKHLIK